MANIYLNVLDSYWCNGTNNGEIVRYADDTVILCYSRKDAERAYQQLHFIMNKLMLTLNPQKTKIVDLNKEGFDFLGFSLSKIQKS